MHYFSDLFDKVLYVSDRSTVHCQEYLNTVYTQRVFGMLVLLASASRRQQNQLWNGEKKVLNWSSRKAEIRNIETIL